MTGAKLEKKLNIFLTIVIVVCAVVCFNICIQRIQGKDASIFGFRFYHILTGSMEPTIQTGTNVLVRTVDTDTLEVGDIITFISRDSNIYGNANTHRIVAISTDEMGGKYFVTKGDANSTADTVRVYPQDVKGKVVFYLKSSGFSMFYKFICTGYGFFSVIMLPLLLVCWFITQDFKRQVAEMKAENEANELRLKQMNESPQNAEISTENTDKEETKEETKE